MSDPISKAMKTATGIMSEGSMLPDSFAKKDAFAAGVSEGKKDVTIAEVDPEERVSEGNKDLEGDFATEDANVITKTEAEKDADYARETLKTLVADVANEIPMALAVMRSTKDAEMYSAISKLIKVLGDSTTALAKMSKDQGASGVGGNSQPIVSQTNVAFYGSTEALLKSLGRSKGLEALSDDSIIEAEYKDMSVGNNEEE